MTKYFTLGDSTLPTIEQVGGKGLSLIDSKQMGFEVPAAVMLSAGFYQPWMSGLWPKS